MSGKACFVTGTDTGVGKTRISVGLLKALNARGHRAIGMKPIASGASTGPSGPASEDALALQAAGHPGPTLEQINPYCFLEPASPDIAAQAAGVSISLARIEAAAARLAERADLLLIEGIGGWRVPLAARTAVPALVKRLDVPVLMVVGLRLGCINHACLTAEAIRLDGLRLAGWFANHIDPGVSSPDRIVATLESWIDAPCLSVVPYLPNADDECLSANLTTALPRLLRALSE